MIMFRIFAILVFYATFGMVSLGTFAYTFVDDSTESYDQSISFQEFLDSEHYETRLTLTNLIQNGQVNENINGWNYANASVSWENGTVKIIPSGTSLLPEAQSPSYVKLINESYYVSGDMFVTNITGISNIALRVYDMNVSYIFGNVVQNQWQTISGIVTSLSSNNTYRIAPRIVSASNVPSTYIFYADNISVFLSSTHTKTQIDTALENYGYLDYNVTYELIDETDPVFQGLYADFFGSYVDFVPGDLLETNGVLWSYVPAEITNNDFFVFVFFFGFWAVIVLTFRMGVRFFVRNH